MQIDIDQIEKIIADVAAHEIMPRFRKLAAADVTMKGLNDPVTIADKAAEKALTLRLTQAYPGSVVVGEESFADDPKIISHFAGNHDVWVVDPIDGTRNFIEGKAEFGTMVALVRNRKTLAAWIHDPNTGDTLMGEQGGGVRLRGHKMRLAGHEGSDTAIIGSRLNKLLAKPESSVWLDRLPALAPGSAAAFDYGRLFTGDALFSHSKASRAAYLVYRSSKAWDHVPGLFLLAEAGGYAATLAGTPYDMENTEQGLLVAPDPERWQALFAKLKPLIEGFIPS